MAQGPSFEFPPDLREMAEKNIQQARAAYGQFMNAIAQSMAVWATAMGSNPVTSGFKNVQDRSVEFAKQNAEACFSLAGEIANAKDMTEVMETSESLCTHPIAGLRRPGSRTGPPDDRDGTECSA